MAKEAYGDLRDGQRISDVDPHGGLYAEDREKAKAGREEVTIGVVAAWQTLAPVAVE